MTGTHRVLIVGGGFGGLYAAKALRRAPVEVTLVDRADHHLYQPLLYQVATGTLTEGEIAPPLRGVLRRQDNARVLLAEVDGFDLDERVAHATAPDGGRLELGYDSLIVAAGAAGSLKTLDDARAIRSRVVRAFERAELATDPAERAAWLRFAVVGGGPTGIELAGHLADLAQRIDTRDALISLVEAGPRVLAEFPEPLARRAARDLAELGVDVWHRARVVDADDEGLDVLSESGALVRVPARTVLWADGVSASPLAEALGAHGGRVAVEGDLTLPGRPEVFVVGDMAAVDGVPGVAPAAIQQGRHAARTIRRRLAGREAGPFQYLDKGRIAVIGRRRAVGTVLGVPVTGRLARLIRDVISPPPLSRNSQALRVQLASPSDSPKGLLPMRHLRTASTSRLLTLLAATVALVLSAAFAQAAISGSDPKPDPKPLDRAIHDAVNAPPVAGVSARVTFTNGLLPAGSLPDDSVSPLAAGAEGRVWLAGDGRLRLELQSDAGDAQIVAGEDRLTVYDSASETAYVLPSDGGHEEREREEVSLADVRRGLDRLATAWSLSGAQPTSTAGRPTYTVRIAPKDDGGLLGAAELAWDAVNGVPLRAAVYAQGQDEPVLELEADEVDYGAIDASTFEADPPAGTRIVEIDPVATDAHGKPTRVRGVDAVQERLGFELSAPEQLAGLKRSSVRLVDAGGEPGALSIYGEGMGAIAVLQHEGGRDRGPLLKGPQVNIDGATGSELATPLGTVLTFRRGEVEFIVIGSVPPVAAENAARGL